MKPKVFVVTLFIVLVFGIKWRTYAEISEIKDHWAHEIIERWIDQGLVQGYSDNSNKLDESISRAEFVTLVNRVFGFKDSKRDNFQDISEGDWFANEIGIASAMDYVFGYDDGTFRPYNYVSRQEAAMMLSRILYLEHYEMKEEFVVNNEEIPSWSREAIESLIKAGIMSGYPDGTIKPNQKISCAETIVILNKALHISMDTITYNMDGVYGPEDGIKILNTNVLLNTDSVILQNLVINGDLLIDEDIEYRDITLKSITVKGKIIIKGGEKDHVLFQGCNLSAIRVKMDKERTKTSIVLSGDFDKVYIKDGNVQLEIIEGEIGELTLDGKTEVSGLGRIRTVNINSDGCIIKQQPSIIRVANNIISRVGGRIVGTAFSDDSSPTRKSPVKDKKAIIDYDKSTAIRTSGERVRAGFNNVTIEIELRDNNGNPMSGEYEIRIDDLFDRTIIFDSYGKSTVSFSVTKTGLYNKRLEIKTDTDVWNSINGGFSFIIINAEAAKLGIFHQPFVNKKELRPQLLVYDQYDNRVYDSIIKVSASVGEGSYELDGVTTIEIDLEKSGGIIEFTDLEAIADTHVLDASIIFSVDGITPVESEPFYIIFFNPKIAGNTKVGEILAITDVYSPSNSITYQWKRNGSDIIGATDINYELTDTDIGRFISVEVKYGDTAMTSDSTELITKGNGTKDHPYAVATIEQLDGYVRDKPSLHYEQIEDIDLIGNDWEPISDFAGVFDGKGYIISNLTSNQLEKINVGLFSRLMPGGELKNIDLESVNIKGDDYVGALVGHSYGSISNCNTEGTVVGVCAVGGLVGYCENGNIVSCSFDGYVIGSTESYFGGLVGKLNKGTISESFSTAVISALNGSSYIGGLVGYSENGNISNCYSTGDVVVGSSNHVGGLIGSFTKYSKIINSYSIGNVESAFFGGGLVGSGQGKANNSYYNKELCGLSDSGKGEGRTTIQMHEGIANSEIDGDKIYVNWDEGIWNFGGKSDYPVLK